MVVLTAIKRLWLCQTSNGKMSLNIYEIVFRSVLVAGKQLRTRPLVEH